jgi:site-specific recombinase XerD
LAPELAAGIARVKSVKTQGIRTRDGLSLRQSQALLSAPDAATAKGLRGRAIIAVVLGCGLRRSEVAALIFSDEQEIEQKCKGNKKVVDAIGRAKKLEM